MNAIISSYDLVHLVYRLLKQDSYYDKMGLFLCANIAAYETNDSFQKWQNTSTMIVVELRKGTPSMKSGTAIKAWQERDYSTIIAMAHKIPKNVL